MLYRHIVEKNLFFLSTIYIFRLSIFYNYPYVCQGIAKCFNRKSETRSVAIFCKVMPENFDKDKFDPKQLTDCPIERKSIEVGKLTELTKDEYADVPPTETEFQLVYKVTQ